MAVSKRLHNLGLVQKAGNCLPHELSEEQLETRKTICELLFERCERKSFLHRILTGDEKWAYDENAKRKEAWILLSEPGPSAPKRNIHVQKTMLCIWWDQEGVVYHELLKPGETMTDVRYKQQLMKLNHTERKFQEKLPCLSP